MAAEVPHGDGDLLVGEIVEQSRELAPAAAGADEPVAQFRCGGPKEMLVLLVGHVVDTPAQRLATLAFEQLAQGPPVLDGHGLPAGGAEHGPDPAGRDVRHDAVKRLAVEVDDPQHLAEVRHRRVDEALPDRSPSSSASPSRAT